MGAAAVVNMSSGTENVGNAGNSRSTEPVEISGNKGDEKVGEDTAGEGQMGKIRVTRQHSLRVYLAGQYSKRRALEAKADELEELGVQITHRWMSYEEGHSPAQVASYAFEDIRAIQTADAVIAVMDDPKYAYRGTFGEICAGLALQKPVIILTPEHPEAPEHPGGKWYCETNVFYWHPSIQHVETWQQVREACAQMCRIV